MATLGTHGCTRGVARQRFARAAGLALGLALGAWGCGSESEAPQAEASFQRIEPAKEKGPELPDPAIWETALDDPTLEAGRQVWTGTCIACHSTGLGGAPLIGNEKLWGPRIEQGLDVLVQHAIEGFYGDVGEMPARGGNAELTDAQVESAVRFMASRAM